MYLTKRHPQNKMLTKTRVSKRLNAIDYWKSEVCSNERYRQARRSPDVVSQDCV
jgi:hypothetical protein